MEKSVTVKTRTYKGKNKVPIFEICALVQLTQMGENLKIPTIFSDCSLMLNICCGLEHLNTPICMEEKYLKSKLKCTISINFIPICFKG